jgi:sigma-B regulation protein RsbU (phosphoserine phosphatase)
MLRHLNALLRQDISSNFFITCFVGILDAGARTFDFASAAHMPLFHFRAADRSIVEIRTKAKPLAPFPDEVFCEGLEERRIVLEPGDLLLQYTDGLNEMRNSSGEEFGFERVRQVLERTSREGSGAVLAGFTAALETFRGDVPQSDDLTLLSINLLPDGPALGARGAGGETEAMTIDA